MRKGFTILEMLALIVIFPVAAIALDGLFTTIIRDIPRSSRILQENISVLSLLDKMQDDIDKAKGVSHSLAGQAAEPNTLLIELADGTIAYELKGGEMIRRYLAKNQQDESDTTTWSVPKAEVRWRVWKKNGQGYAVEVKTYIKLKRPNKMQQKMAGSYLYFLNAL